jgi:HD-like signal output (HDOD) protein
LPAVVQPASRDADVSGVSYRVLVAAPAGPATTTLCTALRGARPQWQVLTASARTSAMAVCGALSLDAVVVDTGLGEDGTALLDDLAAECPRVGRVALTGAPLASAHRTLPRNPPPYPLAMAIQAAVDAAGDDDVDPVTALIANVDDLPSSPATWTRLRTLLADPDVDIRKLSEAISRDVGTTARVMKLVNSAFLGLRRQVTDVREAITVLGLRTISAVVLSAEVMAAFDKLRAVPGLDADALSSHGLATGVVARALLGDRNMADDAFISGLLQDVGQLALASAAPDAFRHCLAEAAWRNLPLHEVEREILGCDHAQTGAALLVLWQMPEPVVTAVAATHTPLTDSLDTPLGVAATVRLAHCLTSTRWSSWRDPGERGELVELAAESEWVLGRSGLEDKLDAVGLVLAGELAGSAAALRA